MPYLTLALSGMVSHDDETVRGELSDIQFYRRNAEQSLDFYRL
jgi:hypothetical protein